MTRHPQPFSVPHSLTLGRVSPLSCVHAVPSPLGQVASLRPYTWASPQKRASLLDCQDQMRRGLLLWNSARRVSRNGYIAPVLQVNWPIGGAWNLVTLAFGEGWEYSPSHLSPNLQRFEEDILTVPSRWNDGQAASQRKMLSFVY